jgi:hypothetical protein
MNVAVYREPERELVGPAPYLDPFDDCPLCAGCPMLLYFHSASCPWWKRYVASGNRMRRGLGTPQRSGYPSMTNDERAAVWALMPPPKEPKPALSPWQQLGLLLSFGRWGGR